MHWWRVGPASSALPEWAGWSAGPNGTGVDDPSRGGRRPPHLPKAGFHRPGHRRRCRPITAGGHLPPGYSSRRVAARRGPGARLEVNVVGTVCLAEAARTAGIRRIVFNCSDGSADGRVTAPVTKSRPLIRGERYRRGWSRGDSSGDDLAAVRDQLDESSAREHIRAAAGTAR